MSDRTAYAQMSVMALLITGLAAALVLVAFQAKINGSDSETETIQIVPPPVAPLSYPVVAPLRYPVVAPLRYPRVRARRVYRV